MRLAAVLFAAVLTTLASAQSSGSLFRSERPDLTVVVRKHAIGPDLVEVTAQDAKYPPELLEEQVNRLAQELQTTPTGLRIFVHEIDPKNPSLKFLRATFSVPGLIDRTEGTLRVGAIARAFAHKGGERSDVLMVQFAGEQPSKKTVSRFEPKDGTVAIQGTFESPTHGVEYRVKIGTDDPNKINVPDRGPGTAPAKAPPKPVATVDWTLIALLVVAALAMGALVYSLLLRARPKTGQRPR